MTLKTLHSDGSEEEFYPENALHPSRRNPGSREDRGEVYAFCTAKYRDFRKTS
jgi:hypothetical protein